MLIPPSRPWHRAENAEELLALSKKLGLTPKKAVEPKPLVYRDLLNGTSEPCKLVGCEGERYAIIDIGGVLHAEKDAAQCARFVFFAFFKGKTCKNHRIGGYLTHRSRGAFVGRGLRSSRRCDGRID